MNIPFFLALRIENFRLVLPDSGNTYKLSMQVRMRVMGMNGLALDVRTT